MSQAPSLLFSPIAGVWVDRVDKHKLLVATQVLAMLQSGLLAYFALRGEIDVPHILALNLLQGFINAVDMPARQSFLVEIVETREDLPNAVALNSSMVNMARLIGPSVAGVLIAGVGEGMCFLIDSLSYIAVIGSLLAMRVTTQQQPKPTQKMRAQLVEGFRYVAGFSPIRAVLLLLTATSIMGAPYTVLMPVVVREVLHSEATALGVLMASSGLGALGAALYLAVRVTILGLGKIIAASAALFGVALFALGLSENMYLSMVLMFVAGACMMLQMAATNTILQTVVDEDKRGRVMSFYTMAVFGTVPVGSLFSGALAERLGAPKTLMLGGAFSLIAAACFARMMPELRKVLRPVYQRLGILPESHTWLEQ